MKNQILSFNFQGHTVRTAVFKGNPYFVGKDVANVLGYVNTNDALNKHVDVEDKLIGSQNATPSIVDSMGRKQYPTMIKESGVYSLIFSSKLPAAKQFKHWVTNEVLPSIRKEGAYVTPQTAFDWMSQPDNMIKFLERYRDAQQENQRLHDENTVMQPKALFADAVSASHTTILVGELAKLLKQNGIDIGQNRLFAWMRANGYLIHRKGTDWNMPTQRSMQQGLFKVKETSIAHSNGSVTVSKTVKVTGKGQQYFINKFLNDEYLDA
ncbi:phage antirepressor [Secundilactobacillus yichangensis]|uniref:phage antirepressor n=1 Tax=Secundilactobacillus yichangensis TaxID=2799580 RepID=UPI0019432B8B|nr:phage antirepressor KilAC domain-containing protein [Secundilactobacillus yichangensis]